MSIDPGDVPTTFLDKANDVATGEPAQVGAITVPKRLIPESPAEVQIAKQ